MDDVVSLQLMTHVTSRVTVHLLPGSHLNYSRQLVFVFVPVYVCARVQFRDEILRRMIVLGNFNTT